MNGILPIDYVARIVCEAIPLYHKGKIIAKDACDFTAFSDFLKEVGKQIGNHSYSKESLLKLIKEMLMMKKIEDLQKLVPARPFCKYPDTADTPMWFKSVSSNPPELRPASSYGTEEYSTSSNADYYATLNITEQTEANTSKAIGESNGRGLSEEEITKIMKVLKYVKAIIPSNPTINDDLMWKYKLSLTQYAKLLELCIKLDLDKKSVYSFRQDSFAPMARVIALLFAEWFKRYAKDTRGSDVTAVIKFDPARWDDFWDKTHIDKKYLHKAEQNTAWVNSLCLLGGFPILYITNVDECRRGKDRFKNLMKSVNDRDNTDSAAAKFDENNTAFSQSLKSGSCKEYLDTLIHYTDNQNENDLPFNVNDKEIEPFKTFLPWIIEFGQDCRSDWFKYYDLELFFDPTENIDKNEDFKNHISAYLSFKIGYKKDGGLIRQEDIKRVLKIDPKDFFTIRIRAIRNNNNLNDNQEVKFIYTRTGHTSGTFKGTQSTNVICIEDILDIEKIEFAVCEGIDGEYKILKEYGYNIFNDSHPIPGLIQLYKEPKYESGWNTKKTPGVTAILGQTAQFKCNYENITLLYDGKYFWHHFSDTFTIEDKDGKKHTFSAEHPKLEVTFESRRIKSELCGIQEDCKVQGKFNGKYHSPILLYGERTNRKGNKTGLNMSVKRDGKELQPNEYVIQYKQLDSREYKRWENNNPPSQGFIRIRIVSCDGTQSTNYFDVFYIPYRAFVTRNLDKCRIEFKCDNVTYLDTGESLKYGYYQDSKPDLKSDEDVPVTKSFQIGNDVNYIELNVFRPFILYKLYKNGNVLTLKDSRLSLQAMFGDELRLTCLDTEGCRDINQEVQPLDYNSALDDIIAGRPNDNNQDWLVYQDNDAMPTTTSGRDIILTNISTKYYKQYHFFYWDTEAKDAVPEQLETSYEEKTKKLTVHCGEGRRRSGIIFQSCYKCNPNRYCRPFYIDNNGEPKTSNQPIDSSRSGYIVANYGSQEKIESTYEIVKKHKCISNIFPAFRILPKRESKPNRCAWLMLYALEINDYLLKDEDLKLLTRIAEENGFDWLIMPRKFWFSVINEVADQYKEQTKSSIWKLLCSSRFLHSNNDRIMLFNMYGKKYLDSSITDNDYFRNPRWVRDKDIKKMIACQMDYKNEIQNQEIISTFVLNMSRANNSIMQKLFNTNLING